MQELLDLPTIRSVTCFRLRLVLRRLLFLNFGFSVASIELGEEEGVEEGAEDGLGRDFVALNFFLPTKDPMCIFSQPQASPLKLPNCRCELWSLCLMLDV